MGTNNVAKGFFIRSFYQEAEFFKSATGFFAQADRKIPKRATSNTVQDSMVPMGFVPVGLARPPWAGDKNSRRQNEACIGCALSEVVWAAQNAPIQYKGVATHQKQGQ